MMILLPTATSTMTMSAAVVVVQQLLLLPPIPQLLPEAATAIATHWMQN